MTWWPTTLRRCWGTSVWLLVGIGAVTLLSLAGCGGHHQACTGSVSGFVFGQPGDPGELRVAREASPPPSGFQPVAGALVTITGSTATAATGADGGFRLTPVAPGQQTVTITAEGYATITVSAVVTAGQDTRVGSDALWTLLVYMDGDNDLEPFAIADMNEMESLAASSEVNLVVQIDRHPGYDKSNGDWTATRRYRIEPDTDTAVIYSPMLADLGELDMADPANLVDFLQWGTSAFPAERYCLVLWNHGSGWVPAQRRPLTRAILYDFTSGTQMSMSQLQSALAYGGPPMDLLVFDACDMALIEVAWACKDGGRLMLASEESEPAEGMPYESVWAPLMANPAMTAQELGSTMGERYVAAFPGWGVTQSLFDLAQTEALTEALSGFADALSTAWPDHKSAISTAAADAQAYLLEDVHDLKHFAQLAKVEVPETGGSVDGLSAAIGTAVLGNYKSGASVKDSYGVAIYLPFPENYYDTRYDSTQFAQHSTWDDFLRLANGG